MADKTVAIISDGSWQANTAYSLNDTVSNDTLKIYKCITAGTSAASGGPTGTGSDITDNTVHWAYQETVAAAYTSLNAALSGESGALPGIVTFNCYNFLDTTAADTGTGYSDNDSTHKINIVSVDSNTGLYSAAAYRLSPGNSHALTVQEDYTEVDGLSVTFGGASSDRFGIYFINVGGVVKNCVIKKESGATGTGLNAINIATVASPRTAYVINNIIYDFNTSGGAGVSLNANAGDLIHCYNNTTVNCDYGFVGNNEEVIIKNCLAVDCTDGFYLGGGGWGTGSDYNASDIASDAPGGNSVDLSAYADTDIFNDPANDDFHLKSSSPCINEGVDLSGIFTTDIDGQTRPTGAGTWDIGADEYISSSTIEQEGFRFRNDDGSESAATWKAAQDTNITLLADSSLRLRALINTTGDAASAAYQLEYRHKPSGGSFGSWKKIIKAL